MEIQRNLFRLTEKLLSLPTTHRLLQYLFAVSLILAVASSGAFCFGQHYLSHGTGRLSECLISNNTLLRDVLAPEALASIIVSDKKGMRYPNMTDNLIMGSRCRVYIDLPSEFSIGALAFSKTYWLPDMSEETRDKLKFKNYTIFIDREESEWYYSFYSDYDLIINELLQSPHFNLTGFETKMDGDTLVFGNSVRQSKLTVIAKSLVGILMLEVISLVYIYCTVVTAPAFLVFVIQHLCCRDTVSRFQVYKVFPWFGIYMLPLERSRNANVSARNVNFAVLLMFILVYGIYIGSMGFLMSWMFLLPCRGQLRENYCGFIAMVEFVSLLLLRTRSSLKYFPTIYLPCQISFLVYCSAVQFGFKNWLFTANSSLTICLLCLFLLKIQIPAINSWNKSKSYTPTENHPRMLYSPSINISWMNDIPDFWTLCVPLFGRSYFRNEEASLVEQNYELLRSTMATHELH